MADGPPSPEQFAQARSSATSEDGLITAVVDGTGVLVELTYDPRVMRRESAALATLTQQTVRAAQEIARAELGELLAGAGPALPRPEQLDATLNELNANAERRLGEMSAALDKLLSREQPR